MFPIHPADYVGAVLWRSSENSEKSLLNYHIVRYNDCLPLMSHIYETRGHQTYILDLLELEFELLMLRAGLLLGSLAVFWKMP